jgi:Protein of unknown function (DUF1553)
MHGTTVARVRCPSCKSELTRPSAGPSSYGVTLRRERLVDQGDASLDPAFEHLSDEQPCRPRGEGEGSGEPSVIAIQPAPSDCRRDQGQLSRDRRQPGSNGGRAAAAGNEEKPADTPEASRRRTVYLPVRRGSMPVMLSMFDFGDATASSEARSRTNVAPQALFMMNSEFAAARSLGVAKLLLEDAALSDRERVARAYTLILARPPDDREVDRALEYIGGLERKLGSPGRQARHLAELLPSPLVLERIGLPGLTTAFWYNRANFGYCGDWFTPVSY